jgi:alpha-L-fucosidase 2
MNNLFDTHPPFQIDGNFGATAGIAEMFIQSHLSNIQILPALPNAWETGSVKGLKARGGFVVDIDWKDSKLVQIKIYSTVGGNCKLMFPNRPKPLAGLVFIKQAEQYQLVTAKGKMYTINF